MAQEYVVGIDPGAHGAVALYDVTNGRIVKVFDMPSAEKILTTGKRTHVLDVVALKDYFEQIVEFTVSQDALLYVHIEKVQAFGKQSAPAAFNFGYTAAIPYTLWIALGYQPKLIPPQTWKKYCGLQATDKDAARQFVLRVFPDLTDVLKYKKDVDRADAILIAMYTGD
jgi:hypothetical protein